MDSTVTITELQSKADRIVRRAEKNGSVSVARRGRTVAFLVSRERIEAILESMEIMSDRKAMKAIRDFEAGKLQLRIPLAQRHVSRKCLLQQRGVLGPPLTPQLTAVQKGNGS